MAAGRAAGHDRIPCDRPWPQTHGYRPWRPSTTIADGGAMERQRGIGLARV